jgi:hypothetical protein
LGPWAQDPFAVALAVACRAAVDEDGVSGHGG